MSMSFTLNQNNQSGWYFNVIYLYTALLYHVALFIVGKCSSYILINFQVLAWSLATSVVSWFVRMATRTRITATPTSTTTGTTTWTRTSQLNASTQMSLRYLRYIPWWLKKDYNCENKRGPRDKVPTSFLGSNEIESRLGRDISVSGQPFLVQSVIETFKYGHVFIF